jgi:hypothetical protein
MTCGEVATSAREIPKNKTNEKRQRGGLAQEPTTHRHGQEVLYVCMYVHLLVVEHLAQEAANWQRPRVHSLHCLDIAPFFKTTSLQTFLRLRNFALATFWALTVRRTSLTRCLYWALLRAGFLRRRSSRSRRLNSLRSQLQKDSMGFKSGERAGMLQLLFAKPFA